MRQTSDCLLASLLDCESDDLLGISTDYLLDGLLDGLLARLLDC